MLTQVVLVQQILLHGRDVGGHGFRTECHESQFFQHHSIVDSIVRIGAPGEWAVGVDENCRDVIGGLFLEGLDDDVAGFFFVFTVNFSWGHLPGTGNFAVEIVAVGSAIGGDAPASLCPAGCPAGVRVDDASDVGEGIVQRHMGSRVGRGLPLPFHLFSGSKGYDHHIFRFHIVVFHAGGFDNHQTFFPVHSRHIAPCKGHKTILWQFQVRFANQFFQFF